MIKPDTLWNLFKHGDKDTIGRVCLALANREGELESPLNPYEKMFFEMIRESEEWMDEAIDAVKKRKHDWYEKKKKGQLPNLTDLTNLTSNPSNPSIDSIDHPPSVRPSVRPSVHKEIVSKVTTTPIPPTSAGGGGDDGGDDGGVRDKGSDEFAHVSKQDVHLYFQRMRTNGGRNISAEVEDEFWQYLVLVDFKKGDGYPIVRSNMHTTFNIWFGNRKKREEEARAKHDEEMKRQEEKRTADEIRREKAELRMAYSLTHETDD